MSEKDQAMTDVQSNILFDFFFDDRLDHWQFQHLVNGARMVSFPSLKFPDCMVGAARSSERNVWIGLPVFQSCK